MAGPRVNPSRATGELKMYWHEDTHEDTQQTQDEVVDLLFRIDCRALPLDHAFALSQGVRQILPWLDHEPLAGIHVIHGAGSQNGWYRPDETPDAILYLSRRARMTLRLPKMRVEAARALSGADLAVGDHPMRVGDAQVKPFEPLPTLFARYVVAPEAADEGTFVEWVAQELTNMGIRVRKILCGKSHYIQTPGERLFTRSVMVADLSREESLKLQQLGIGPDRKLGCGLFIPHKGIAPVKKASEE